MKLTEFTAIRVKPEDRENIDATAKRLDLSASEVMRRAMRLGLPILRHMHLPGGTPGKPRREPPEVA